MLLTDQHPHNKSLTTAVIGVPNAGKSSLINALIGLDLSIVTNKAQTTRNKFHCVTHIDHTELVFVDTPGVHKTNQEMNIRMNGQAVMGTFGADVNLLVLDLTEDLFDQYKQVMKEFNTDESELKRTWVAFNKSDLIENKKDLLKLDNVYERLKVLIPSLERSFIISSTEEYNLHELTGALLDAAVPGPHLYPGGDISNKNMRFFATEYIREQAFTLLSEEVPYEVAVLIDEYKDLEPRTEGDERLSRISASILVNRPSQRAIVVGSKGINIKTIGTNARVKLEELIGNKVFLNLHVKVTPKWFKNNKILEEVGLPRVDKSRRVWRAK